MPTPPLNDGSQICRPKLSCNQCDRSFSRPSHLNRHRLTHLPPSRRNTIPCLYCDQAFSRKDVLIRHLRTTHNIDVPTNISQQKSCYRCVQRKLKCNRGLPCHSCALGNTPESCSYPPIEQSYSNESQLLEQVYDHQVTEDSASESESFADGQREFTISSPETLSCLSQTLDPVLLDAEGFAPVLGGRPAVLNDTAMAGLPLTNGVQYDFRYSGFDWLDFDVPDVELITSCPGVELFASSSTIPEPVAESSLTILPPQVKGPAVPWPFDQGQETISARCHLPPLHAVLQKALQTTPSSKEPALEGLVEVLSNQYLPRPEDVTAPNMCKGIDLLRRLLVVYFSTFQQIQPILHAPTWHMEDYPTTLLATMACLGAVLSNEPNPDDLASSISDVCAPLISWMGVSDTENYSSISYLTSLCLHQIYSLGSGNRQLYQNADRTRGVLFGSLRGLGLLKSRSNAQEISDPSSSMHTNAADLESEWRNWVSRENETRLAWASFEYDCSLCTLTSRRGAIDLSELPLKLPCMESLWEAPSTSAWVALKSRSTPSALGVSASIVISSAVSGTPLPEPISTWGKRLCGQVIGRLLWDLKQLELLSTTDHFGLSALSTGQKQSKVALLGALDRLLETMNNPVSTSDLVSYNISSLLCHYSHLYTADDIMDMILYIVRSVVSRGPNQEKGIDPARRRLISAFGNDPRRARMLAWHAGQIIAVANEYLVSAPCEIMRLFMSYIFIVAFVQYYPRLEKAGASATVQLDLPGYRPEQKKVVEEWVQTGGPARIGNAQDILAEGSIKIVIQDAQVMLQKLRSWGLAEKFAKILQCFGTSMI